MNPTTPLRRTPHRLRPRATSTFVNHIALRTANGQDAPFRFDHRGDSGYSEVELHGGQVRQYPFNFDLGKYFRLEPGQYDVITRT